MKKTLEVNLHSIDDTKKFVNIVSSIEGKVTISSDCYAFNAKSIVAICTLDLSKPLHIEIQKWEEKYANALKPFLFS